MPSAGQGNRENAGGHRNRRAYRGDIFMIDSTYIKAHADALAAVRIKGC
ncbi:hypothetical protein [Treponema endosymbiont of Eucomonympha sp.]|nr:hypothetical protein [Treponema endosymbiont of Eucomonympha sp.]